MTHILTLMRHAKSSWKTPGLADHDRELNARGKRDAPLMAQRLLDRDSVPDLIFCSSAIRALETAQCLISQFNACAPELKVEPELYLSSPSTIIRFLQGMDPATRHILVIAHNPGLEDLSALLMNSSPTHFPTAGIRQFSCPSWEHLPAQAKQSSEPAQVQMIYDDNPKKL